MTGKKLGGGEGTSKERGEEGGGRRRGTSFGEFYFSPTCHGRCRVTCRGFEEEEKGNLRKKKKKRRKIG